MPDIAALLEQSSARSNTFAPNHYGSPSGPLTTFSYTAGFDTWLSSLDTHSRDHAEREPQTSPSPPTDPFPPYLSYYICQAMSAAHASGSIARPPPAATPPPPRQATADVYPTQQLPMTHARTMNPPPPPPPQLPTTHVRTLHAPPPPPPPPPPPAPPPTLPTASPQMDPTAPPTPQAAPPEKKPHFQRELGDLRASTRQGARTAAALLAWGSASSAITRTSAWSDTSRNFFNTSGRACLATATPSDPTSRADAHRMDHDGWSASEQKELDNHKTNGSFEWIDKSAVPHGRQLVKLTWVFKVKRDGRKKSRLCVQGCSQKPGIDYDLTTTRPTRRRCAPPRSASCHLSPLAAASTCAAGTSSRPIFRANCWRGRSSTATHRPATLATTPMPWQPAGS